MAVAATYLMSNFNVKFLNHITKRFKLCGLCVLCGGNSSKDTDPETRWLLPPLPSLPADGAPFEQGAATTENTEGTEIEWQSPERT